jgi:hypothetical protein
MKVLAIDIGGTNIKFAASGHEEPTKFPSGLEMTPAKMIEGLRQATEGWEFDLISIGYPGPVVNGSPALDPKNLGPGWVGYDFAGKFGKPVKVINDAAMQALGSYQGGRMLFLGLGTGLGSALVVDNVTVPLELAHLPYKKGYTFEDYVGIRGLKKLGKKKWQRTVEDVVARLKNALIADYVVLGGGNAKQLTRLPAGSRMGDNLNAFSGGFRLWNEEYSHG